MLNPRIFLSTVLYEKFDLFGKGEPFLANKDI